MAIGDPHNPEHLRRIWGNPPVCDFTSFTPFLLVLHIVDPRPPAPPPPCPFEHADLPSRPLEICPSLQSSPSPLHCFARQYLLRWFAFPNFRAASCIAFPLLRISQVSKDEEGDDALFFGLVVRFWPTITFKGVFEGRVHKECIRINRRAPCVICTVSKSAKSTEQHFKVCYSRTQKFFTVPLDPQYHPCYMNHVQCKRRFTCVRFACINGWYPSLR